MQINQWANEKYNTQLKTQLIKDTPYNFFEKL